MGVVIARGAQGGPGHRLAADDRLFLGMESLGRGPRIPYEWVSLSGTVFTVVPPRHLHHHGAATPLTSPWCRHATYIQF